MVRLTRAQVREVDRLAVERYHVPAVVLMENASLAVADAACEMLEGNCAAEILILCGGGNNGGDGLAAARHLHNRGASVSIAFAADPGKYRNEARINWQVVRAMGLETRPADPDGIERSRALLIIDAIFGTGLAEPPREPFADLAAAVARSRIPVLAVDLPSGLDCDTGEPLGPCITATRTVTFVAEKAGFANPDSRRFTGEITVGDIGCPRELIEEVTRPAG